MKNPALAYRQFSVQGATPLGLVVMLYDGAITAILRAATAVEAQDVSDKCIQLNKAQAIIAQLEGTLNFEAGGEVAQTLKALYVHARGQMLKASFENSPVFLRSLAENLATVREAWYKAEHSPLPSPATTATGGPSPEAPPEARSEPQHIPRVAAAKRSPYATSLDTEPRSWSLTG
jgi:flagellar protein FliS